ncbi:MAG: porin family protein [Prevotellaceae bacterium]|jgi:hypothetical protein|nr:porin family protein [Prevotellaceae bacterium]
MKKILIITLLTAACSVASIAQTHFPKNFNVDLGGGINDAADLTPVVGAGYAFSNRLSLYGRYSFATGKIEGDMLTYREQNAELYTLFTLLAFQDRYFVSPLVGVAYKNQDLRGIPVPSNDVKGNNFGGVIGVEGEWHFARYISVFGNVNYRGLFLVGEPRLEFFASVGVRTSLRVFKKAGR